ncbi:MAG TPA: hypothetical protein PK725_06540, partial [Rhodocyclaceae bacterium]|nr:hypothetical protein [Rhodocyclaceae bacterium]
GPWLLRGMKWLARGKRLRGTRLDPFGRTAERRMERELVRRYAEMIALLLGKLGPETLEIAVALASLPDGIRGFGHVKLESLRHVISREAELMRQLGEEELLAKAMPQDAHHPRAPESRPARAVTVR